MTEANLAAPVFYVAVRNPSSSYEERLDQSERVISLAFEDTEAKADKLTLSVDNYDLSQLDSPLWQPGNIVVFSFGYPGAMSPQREMKIQTVKGFNPLQVEALGDEVIFNRKPRTDRHWENTTRSEVVRAIAKEYGYTGAQLHIDDTKLVVEQVTQGCMTDLQLIKLLAYRDGFEFYIDFDGFHFHKRKLDQRPMKVLWYFTDPGKGDIVSISVEDGRKPGSSGALTLQGRDPMTKQSFAITADDKSTSRTVLATERTRYAPDELYDDLPSNENGLAPGVADSALMATAETTETAARQSAGGRLTKAELESIKLTITCRGDAQVLAKSLIQLGGVGARYSGNYYVLSASHALGAGYTMQLKLRRDGHEQAVGVGAMKATTKPTDAPKNVKAPWPPELYGQVAVGGRKGTFETRYVIDPVTGEKREIYVPASRGGD